MFDSFKDGSKKIIVGIPSFDEPAFHLLKSSESLALRTGMSLRLVHAFENVIFPYGLYPAPYMSPDFPYPSQAELEEITFKNLKELKPRLNPQINVEINATFGAASTVLIAEAQLQRAPLIICGVKPEDHKYIPRAFSTVLTLMSESPTPILAIPNHRSFDFEKTPLTIIVGDDFSEQSQTALAVASELAISLGGVKLVHLHIHKRSREEMEKIAEQVMDGLTKIQLERDERYSPSQIFETILGSTRATMESRLGGLRPAISSKNGNAYESLVLFGEPETQLANAVNQLNADLLVFGRHQWLHKRPFSLGKMPAHAMLNLHKPLLSVRSSG